MVELATPELPPPLAGDARMATLARLIWQQHFEADLSPLLVYLVDTVRDDLLGYLAEQLHVMGIEGWNLAETPEQQRRLIKESIAMHRMKGTPAALHALVERLGFCRVTLIEGLGKLHYDGAHTYNGHMVHGDPKAWPTYRVILLDRALTNEQADRLRQALAAYAPARCLLAALDYQSVPIRYNAHSLFDGQYNHGSA